AKDMYEDVWKEKFLSGSGNTVMVHVLNLRRKIEENPSNPKIIRTVWGKGYQID
ncbi:MAG: winged helix-turn-helix domain-containing protein, partial [Oscillospiraceae bacterium]|nr:winged helix-turn-helix domain-containing protein [Oscillospiraceae bacterium]